MQTPQTLRTVIAKYLLEESRWYSFRSDVPSTRFQTLNQIIELSVYNDSVRKLLKEEVLAAINALRLNPTEWCHMSESLQISARRALIALEDNNISSIMREYQRDSCENNSRLAYALWRFLL